MLVRRIATVTISAPAASVARRVASRSLNLPVPVGRPERALRPAITGGSVAGSTAAWMGMFMVGIAEGGSGWRVVSRQRNRASAAAYRVHDLDAVAVGEFMQRVTAARHDLAVHLDGDAAPGVTRGLEQLRERNRGVDFVLGAVEQDLHAHSVVAGPHAIDR